MFFLHLISNFNDPKSNNPSIKFPTFKTFLSLVLKFTVPLKEILNEEFHRILFRKWKKVQATPEVNESTSLCFVDDEHRGQIWSLLPEVWKDADGLMFKLRIQIHLSQSLSICLPLLLHREAEGRMDTKIITASNNNHDLSRGSCLCVLTARHGILWIQSPNAVVIRYCSTKHTGCLL